MAQTLQRVLEIFFCCWHRNISRPFTLSGRTYEVCLECGKQFAYCRVDLGQGWPEHTLSTGQLLQSERTTSRPAGDGRKATSVMGSEVNGKYYEQPKD